ncbi:hypothetical protein [Bradyrhizobium nanningense]|uniref:hypothetical protein n=1 Tax=Bradyrhizobium nanningense TaxID=1325118 RepID=UPI0010086FFE|nr:hypothetical protein [Bradyrhizobium nanningense]
MTPPITQDNIPRKTKFTFEEAVDVGLHRWAGQFQREVAAPDIVEAVLGPMGTLPEWPGKTGEREGGL